MRIWKRWQVFKLLRSGYTDEYIAIRVRVSLEDVMSMREQLERFEAEES